MSSAKMSITLPKEMADLIEAKVDSGEYASESEVIRDGLRTLFQRDAVVETWLQSRVAAAFDQLKADPERALTGDQIREELYSLVAQRDKNAA